MVARTAIGWARGGVLCGHDVEATARDLSTVDYLSPVVPLDIDLFTLAGVRVGTPLAHPSSPKTDG